MYLWFVQYRGWRDYPFEILNKLEEEGFIAQVLRGLDIDNRNIQ